MNKNNWFNTFKNKSFYPKIVVLDLNDPCFMNCSFCPKSSPDIKLSYSNKYNNYLNNVYSIIDFFIDLGVQSFEITPTIGDSINNKYLLQILEYINSKNKNSFMFTSLLGPGKDIPNIDKIINTPNFYMVISVYGLTKKTFYKKTKSNRFQVFKNNLLNVLNLKSNNKSKNNFIIIRNRFNNSDLDFKLFNSLKNKYQDSNILFELYHPDIEECSEDCSIEIQNRKNICCNFLINFGCDLNGNIRFCNYSYSAPIIGNIFDGTFSKESLKDYFKYLDNEFCKNCKLYEPIELEKDITYDNIVNTSYTFSSFNAERKINIGLVNLKETNEIK
jgi:hypothetical protein